MWHDSFTRDTTRSYTWRIHLEHHTFIHATWLIHFIPVTCLIHTWHNTYSRTHDAFTWGTAYSYMRRDSFILYMWYNCFTSDRTHIHIHMTHSFDTRHMPHSHATQHTLIFTWLIHLKHHIFTHATWLIFWIHVMCLIHTWQNTYSRTHDAFTRGTTHACDMTHLFDTRDMPHSHILVLASSAHVNASRRTWMSHVTCE